MVIMISDVVQFKTLKLHLRQQLNFTCDPTAFEFVFTATQNDNSSNNKCRYSNMMNTWDLVGELIITQLADDYCNPLMSWLQGLKHFSYETF